MKHKLTGHAEIDQQHAVLHELIDRLGIVCELATEQTEPSCQTCSAARRRACSGALASLSDEVLSFLVGHATYEEKLMELLPDIPRCRVHINRHKDAHADISDRLRELATRIGREAPRTLGTQLHRIALDWMGSHASQFDAQLAEQVEALGPIEIEFDKELVAILDELVFHHRPTRTASLRRLGIADSQRSEVQARLATLTGKQREVCRLVARGMANKEVAKRQGVTINTIKTHRAEIFRKLNVTSLLELVRILDIAGIGEAPAR